MNIEQLLTQDGVKAQLAELLEDVTEHFDDIEAVALLWSVNGDVKHRYFGSQIALLGILTLAQNAWASYVDKGSLWREHGIGNDGEETER